MSSSTRSSKDIGLIQKRLRRVMASEQIERIPCEGKPVDPELMTVLEVVDEPTRSARDRGQGAAARLYLEGPRDPLRGSAGGTRGLEDRRPPRTTRRTRARAGAGRRRDAIDVETDTRIAERSGSTRTERGMTT